jgi:hypothetical protein
MLLVAALSLASCKHYVKTVVPHEDLSFVEPEEAACQEKDFGSFLESRLGDIEECTQKLSCKDVRRRTFTLMVGCNGTKGGLAVVSGEELSGFNDCLVGKGEVWDYSTLCTAAESECTWSMKVDVVCTLE